MQKRKNDVSKIQSPLRRKSARLSIVSPNPKDENGIYYEECIHMIRECKIHACMFNINQVMCIRNFNLDLCYKLDFIKCSDEFIQNALNFSNNMFPIPISYRHSLTNMLDFERLRYSEKKVYAIMLLFAKIVRRMILNLRHTKYV